MAIVCAWPIGVALMLGLADFVPLSRGRQTVALGLFVFAWGGIGFTVVSLVIIGGMWRRVISTSARLGGGSPNRSRLESLLLAATAAVPCAALIVGGTFGDGLKGALDQLSFDPEGLLVVMIDGQRSHYALDDDAQVYRQSVASELAARFPSTGVALASIGPLDYSAPRQFVIAKAHPTGSPRLPMINFVSSNYFDVVGTKLLRGRPPVGAAPEREAAIDATLERELFGQGSGIGSCIFIASRLQCVRITGITPARRARRLSQATAELFMPVEDASDYGLGNLGRTILVNATADTREGIITFASRPSVVPVQVQEASNLVRTQSRPWRLGIASLSTVGIVAFMLAIVGVSASTALDVRTRVQEIGIRLALGAPSRTIVFLLMRRGTLVAFSGAALGATAAVLIIGLLQSRVLSVPGASAASILWNVLAVVGGTMAGIALPAGRAARLDANAAMRE